ncbi:hypothetical protein F6455_14040 [Proteobacteria bacterium 005FR1]|nr:hypothetical protein [Proteobacteria bacterium 005FR1]
MADQQAQKKLFEVPDKGAFQPVLNTNESDVPENKRDKLQHVKRATESERHRFRSYESAEKMYQMYRDDLSSGAAESVNRDLEDLDLPKLADCQQQVENTARELGIR